MRSRLVDKQIWTFDFKYLSGLDEFKGQDFEAWSLIG